MDWRRGECSDNVELDSGGGSRFGGGCGLGLGGTVVPDAFTDGTSAQRVRWFKTGLDSGDMRQRDTFASVP